MKVPVCLVIPIAGPRGTVSLAVPLSCLSAPFSSKIQNTTFSPLPARSYSSFRALPAPLLVLLLSTAEKIGVLGGAVTFYGRGITRTARAHRLGRVRESSSSTRRRRTEPRFDTRSRRRAVRVCLFQSRACVRDPTSAAKEKGHADPRAACSCTRHSSLRSWRQAPLRASPSAADADRRPRCSENQQLPLTWTACSAKSHPHPLHETSYPRRR